MLKKLMKSPYGTFSQSGEIIDVVLLCNLNKKVLKRGPCHIIMYMHKPQQKLQQQLTKWIFLLSSAEYYITLQPYLPRKALWQRMI